MVMKWTIIDRKPIMPEVEDTFDGWRRAWLRCIWVVDDLARRIVTAKGTRNPSKMRALRLWIFSA